MTIVDMNAAHMQPLGKTTLRVALGALVVLMAPIIGSRVVEGWNWSAGSFVFVYFLFFATGMAYALIARKMRARSYKAGVALALVTGFALGWSNMVQVAGSDHPANLAYNIVLVVGCVGVALARLKARGLARTMFAMAAVVVLINVLVPSGMPPEVARNIAIGHVGFVVLFAASGLLFRHASRTESQ